MRATKFIDSNILLCLLSVDSDKADRGSSGAVRRNDQRASIKRNSQRYALQTINVMEGKQRGIGIDPVDMLSAGFDHRNTRSRQTYCIAV